MSNFSFKTNDVPAAAGTYTYIGVTGVDASGDAVGYYGNVDGDGDGTFHGFIALVNGNGIPLDPPGSTNTSVGMTASGVIFGDYTYLNHQYGFVDNGGVFTTFDYGIAEATPPSVPIAISTDVDGITNAGVVYGDYADYVINNDNQPGWQGFLNNNGVVTLVSFPGANITTLADINSAGTIVGNYEFGGNTNAGWIGHGFVDHNGSFTSIDVPGAYSTSVVGISDGGVIAGNYQDNASNEFGFVDNNGVFTTISIPGGTNVLVNAINATGEIVGDYLGADNKVHGYIDNNGVITTVDVPGSTFTEIDGVNANGQIFGSYDDSMGNQHGFVGSPLPATTIESFGATSLTQVGNDYFLYAKGTTNGPGLTYSGTPWAAGQAWAPIGVEKTSSGYEVALFNASSHLYTIWNTDSGGNVLSASIAGVSGTNAALESIETSFQQDLNGDGTIGIPVASGTIEAFGATKLVQVGNDYFFNPVAGGSGPELTYGGTPWAAGQAWAPIGVEKISSGYEVALLNASTHLFTIWNTDSSGNVLGASLANASGTSAALESAEVSFQQDLNGDGVIGVPSGPPASSTTIEASGSTALVQTGNDYFLNPIAGGSGPELTYSGTPWAAGQAWAPIGVETTSTGYEVALFNASSQLYTIWNTDSSGNVLSASIAGVSSTNTALESIETSFYQDLNGDGVIDSAATVIEAKGHVVLTLNAMAQPASIDAGATLELTGADSGTVTFNGATGTLILDHSTQFSGQVLNLTGTGNLASSDQLDLRDIGFGAGTTVGYSGTSAGGILTVSDAQNHTAHIALTGDYTHSTFALSSDGNGGTTVIDPVDDQPAASGTLSFSDPDASATPSVSVTAQSGGAGTLGSFVADLANAANGQDTVGWHFNFDSGPAAGNVTQSYAVTVADHHADGTSSAVTQTVSVTIGGPGNDGFVFHPGMSSDTIVNGASINTIELDGFASMTSNSQLATLLNEAQTGQSQTLFESVNGGHDTLINLGNHDSITLTDVQIADLHASHFIIH